MFKLSSPLDKDDSATNVATLDGLANAGALGVTFRRVVTSGFRNPESVMQMCDFAKITRVVRDRCADLAGADGLLTDDEERACETGPVQFSSVKLSTAELREVGCSFLEDARQRRRSLVFLEVWLRRIQASATPTRWSRRRQTTMLRPRKAKGRGRSVCSTAACSRARARLS